MLPSWLFIILPGRRLIFIITKSDDSAAIAAHSRAPWQNVVSFMVTVWAFLLLEFAWRQHLFVSRIRLNAIDLSSWVNSAKGSIVASNLDFHIKLLGKFGLVGATHYEGIVELTRCLPYPYLMKMLLNRLMFWNGQYLGNVFILRVLGRIFRLVMDS
jgi:hypothetical protein